ncbi:MAG TPA: amidohydrolase family protein [Burkholderiales bacterium]|nr:amidohydrolase family protein [Burkholderiales bacterium]
MQAIDLHNHVLPEPVLAAMEADPGPYRAEVRREGARRYIVRGSNRFEITPEFYDADAKVEIMERKGVRISAISPAPQSFCYWLDEAQAARHARLVNDGIAQMVAKRPDRLRGMATLPMRHPEAAVAELERAVKELGFKAVEIATAIDGEELAHPRFRPVLRRAQELEVTVFTHPNTMGTAAGRLDCYYLINLIGNPLDTTIMVAKLMFSGALDELKDLKILLAHGGGFVPYQIGRFQHGHTVRPDTSADTKSKPLDLFKRFYYDALTHHPQALRHLIDMVGSDHVVIGTDSPFDMGEERPLERLNAVPRLTEKEHADIAWRTAQRLLGED